MVANVTINDLSARTSLAADDVFEVDNTSSVDDSEKATFALMGGLEIATSAPTSTNVTPAVGEFHWLDLSGVTTASFVLPASANVGERVGVGVEIAAGTTQGNELDIRTNDDSDKINGNDGNWNTNAWSMLLIQGEVLVFECVSNTAGVHDWALLVDARKPIEAKIGLSANQTSFTAAAWTQVNVNSSLVNIGGCVQTGSNQIICRRPGRYFAGCSINTTTNAVAADGYVRARAFKNATTRVAISPLFFCSVAVTGQGAGYFNTNHATLAAGDTIKLQAFVSAWSSSAGDILAGEDLTFLSITENLKKV